MSNLSDFKIEDGVLTKYFGEDLNVMIPSSVKSISEFAFTHGHENCYSLGIVECRGELQSIFIPKSVIEIGELAFSPGANFEIYYEGTEEDWDCVTIKKQEEWLEEPVVLFNCGTINEADATAGVIYSTSDIEDFGCEVAEVIRKTGGHTNVVISATYKELPVALIQSCAFFGDSSLKSVVIPNSVKYIGSWAFYNCENLSSATIPSSVTDFGDDVFDGCGNLVIKGEAGSYAEKYAKENDIPFEAI